MDEHDMSAAANGLVKHGISFILLPQLQVHHLRS